MTTIRDILETAVLAIPLAFIVVGFCVSIYGGYLLITATTALELAKGLFLIPTGVFGGLSLGIISLRIVEL